MSTLQPSNYLKGLSVHTMIKYICPKQHCGGLMDKKGRGNSAIEKYATN